MVYSLYNKFNLLNHDRQCEKTNRSSMTIFWPLAKKLWCNFNVQRSEVAKKLKKPARPLLRDESLGDADIFHGDTIAYFHAHRPDQFLCYHGPVAKSTLFPRSLLQHCRPSLLPNNIATPQTIVFTQFVKWQYTQ